MPDLKSIGVNEIYGSWTTDATFAAVDIQIWPCATAWTDYNGTQHGGHSDCKWDKKEVMDYLGESLNTQILINEGTFRQENYDNTRIERTATLKSA